MPRTFDTSNERQGLRDALKSAKSVATNPVKSVTYSPSIVQFVGRASDDVPLFRFIAPCKGYISSIIFDNSTLGKFNVSIETVKIDKSIHSSTMTISKMIEGMQNNEVDYGDIITISLPNQKGINADRDIFVSFIFNILV